MLAQCNHESATTGMKKTYERTAIGLERPYFPQKVMLVRKQIEQGTYSIENRIDAVVEKMLLDLH